MALRSVLLTKILICAKNTSQQASETAVEYPAQS